MFKSPEMVEVPAAKVPVPVAFVKERFVMVEVAKVEFTEIVGVPVAEESVMFVPAVSDWTPMFVNVWMPFAVPIEMPVPAEKVCVLEVEPFKDVMPVADAGSHERPFGAVEDEVKT
jgi:hypothetical protein